MANRKKVTEAELSRLLMIELQNLPIEGVTIILENDGWTAIPSGDPEKLGPLIGKVDAAIQRLKVQYGVL